MNWPHLFYQYDWLINASALIAGLLISAGWVVWCTIRGKCKLKEKRYLSLLKERLDFYSMLLNENPNPANDSEITKYLEYAPVRPILGSGSHKILLGVLKKVETKNGVVLAVTILLLGGMISISTTVMNSSELLQATYLFIVGFLVGPLVSAIDGAGHLGQPRYISLVERSCSKSIRTAQKCRMRDMQKELLVDLVSKEYAFQVKVWTSGLSILMVVIFLFFLLSAQMICEAVAR